MGVLGSGGSQARPAFPPIRKCQSTARASEQLASKGTRKYWRKLPQYRLAAWRYLELDLVWGRAVLLQ